MELAREMAGTRTCCIAHGGQAYWQIQRQVSIPEAADALAWENPTIETDAGTAPNAWCTEFIAYCAERANAPYIGGYATARHHPSSFVERGREIRQWYKDEEAIGGAARGRWIDGGELDYANFEPGVNGPCPGAYQQICTFNPADADGDGDVWTDAFGHSQMVDTMVVYRLGAVDGPVQRIDVHMVEGNVGLGDGSVYASAINTRWYRDILPFTTLGPDATVLDTNNRKIRGWGVPLDGDGNVDYDPARIETIVTFMIRAFPAPTGPTNEDSQHVAQMVAYHATTGGVINVSSNSPLVQTGGGLPTETNPWVIPPGPHPVNPVYIDIDLGAQHPNLVRGVTIDWLEEAPRSFEVWWSGVPVQINTRAVSLPTPPPTLPFGTTHTLPVMFSPGMDAGYPVRYARICITNAALTRTFTIRGFHYNFYSTEVEDNGGSSPDGDAIASDVGDGAVPSALWLSTGAPNPFEGTTTLSFGIPASGAARVTLYDVRGKLVRTLVAGARAAGPQEVTWDGNDERGQRLPSGVYFARLEAHGAVVTRKVVLIR